MNITFIQRLKRWYRSLSAGKRRLFWIGGVIALLVVFSLIKNGRNDFTVETVKRQDLARTVLASGSVVSSTDLALSFQEGDIVRSVNVVVGQKVKAGQILATLDQKDEYPIVTKARGELLAAEARYKKVLEGESNEEIRLAETKFENAQRELYSTDLIAEAQSDRQTSIEPVISGSYNSSEAGAYRISFDNLSTRKFRFGGLERGTGTMDDEERPLGMRGLLVAFPDDIGGYSVNDEWVITIPNTKSTSYVANYNAYKSAEAELNIKKANARDADVDAALAEVITARGSLESAQAELEKTYLRAPADGTITSVDIKPGEIAEAFKQVMVLQDISNLYLEADVNESSVAHITIDQPVTVSYDALGGNTQFRAKVSSVDPAATIVDGIVNYKVKALVEDPAEIRPGMTADLSIQTAFVPNVLVIPNRVITEKDGAKTVSVLIDERRGTKETRTITTGLKGDGDLVEVTSGLSEGEQVVFQPAQ